MKKKSVMYMIVVGLILSIGVSYAYFTGVIKGSGNKFKVSAKEVYVIFTDTSEITEEQSEVTPGWNVTKTFTVKNESGNKFNYNIVINDLINTFETSGYLQYKITSTNGLNMSEYKDIPKSLSEQEVVLEYDIDIPENETQNYNIEFIYRNDEEKDQSIDMGKVFGGSLGIKEGTVNPNVFYSVTLRGENITIDEETKRTIKRKDVEFNVEAIEGYNLGNNVSCDNEAVGVIENGKVTVSNVTENTICTLNSDIKEYIVNISVENGSSNEIDRKVSHGDNTTFTIEPDEGYTIEGATITGEKCSIEGSTVTISNVRSNEDTCNITLLKEKYNVYLSGNINVSSPIEVAYKESGTFNITPQEGYELENTNINCDNEGIATREGNIVTVSNITKETRCEISTSQLKYNVTINVINGSGNETKEVIHGSFGEFSISANTGYNTNINASTDITCTGSAEKSISGSIVKISNVTGSQTCTVTLKPNEYNLEVTSNNDSWGTVSPSSGKIIHGNILEINITPASGYKYKENTCGVEPVNNKITINVSGNIKCQVIFESSYKTLYATLTDGVLYPAVNTRSSFDDAFGTSTAISGVIYKESTYIESEGNNNKDVYYFAGNVSDNWVSFAGYNWRIIRTNEDGGVRLLYAGVRNTTAPYYGGDTTTGYIETTSRFGDCSTKKWSESSIKPVVEEWYSSNILTNYDKYISKTAMYCNDTSSVSISSMKNGSGLRLRDLSPQPSYQCGSEVHKTTLLSSASPSDKYSVSTSSGGSGTLSQPVALMTADEVAFAGGAYDINSPFAYYYLNESGSSITGSNGWITMSPAWYDSWTASLIAGVACAHDQNIFSIASNGKLYKQYAVDNSYLRPVLSLKSCVQVKSGNGTISSPFEVQVSSSCAQLEN